MYVAIVHNLKLILPRWNSFIDVCTTNEIKSGDRLTVIPKPGLSSPSAKVYENA